MYKIKLSEEKGIIAVEVINSNGGGPNEDELKPDEESTKEESPNAGKPEEVDLELRKEDYNEKTGCASNEEGSPPEVEEKEEKEEVCNSRP